MNREHGELIRKAYFGLGAIADLQGKKKLALRYYQRIFDYQPRIDEKAEILQLMGQIYVDLSLFPVAQAMARKARQVLQPWRNQSRTNYHRALASVNELRSWIYRMKGDTSRALREARAGLMNLPKKIRDRETMSYKTTILNTIGGIYYLNGDRRCLRYYQRALKIEQRLGNIRTIATLKQNLGNAFSGFGDNTRAIALIKEYLKISERIGDRNGVATATETLGCIFYYLDNHRQAIDYLLRSFRISEQIGSIYGISYTSNNLGVVYSGIGETDKALEFFRRDLSIARANGIKRNEARALYNIGLVYLKQGEYRKARQYFEASLPILMKIRDRIRLQNVMHRLAVALVASRAEHQRALRLIRRSAQLARRSPPRSEIAAVHVSYGKIMGFFQNPAGVKFHFDKALAIYRQDKLRRLEGEALMEYAGALLSLPKAGRSASVLIRELLEQARQIYLQLGIKLKADEAERMMQMIEQKKK